MPAALVAIALLAIALLALGSIAVRFMAGGSAGSDGRVQQASRGEAPRPGAERPAGAEPRLTPGVNTPLIVPAERFGEAAPPAAEAASADRGVGAVKFGQAVPSEPVGRRPESGPTAFEMKGPFNIIDGRTFGDSTITVSLSLLDAPDRSAVCVNDTGQLWGCGLRARAALNNLLRGQSLACQGDLSKPEPVEASCRSPSGDLAAQVVLTGYARPVSGVSAFDAETAEARAARRGLWNGGWHIRPAPPVPDPLPASAPP